MMMLIHVPSLITTKVILERGLKIESKSMRIRRRLPPRVILQTKKPVDNLPMPIEM
jgi:hypothetical protein